jgi:hypothetical protein
MLAFLFKVLMLPLMLLIEVYGVFVALIGIVETRTKMFFSDDIFEEDYHTNTTTRKIVLSIPFVVVLCLEVVILVPVFLCARIVNTIMEVIPLIMIIPSFILGALLALLVAAFNFANYYMLDESKRSQFTLAEFVEVHPAAVITRKMGG